MNEQFPDFEQTITRSLESKQQHTVHVLERDLAAFASTPEFALIKDIQKNGEYLRNVYNAEEQVSEISEKPKYTDQLVDCTGIAVTGIEKNTGTILSFISHSPTPDRFNIFQSYEARLYEEETGRKQDDSVNNFEQYEALIQERMKEISQRCEKNSIAATIYGGAVIEGYAKGSIGWKPENEVKEELLLREQGYQQSVASLQAVSTSCLGIEAQVIEPVRFIPEYFMGTEIYLDTKNQDMYVRYAEN